LSFRLAGEMRRAAARWRRALTRNMWAAGRRLFCCPFGLLIERRPVPRSRVFGFDRGLPVDRYYIEAFLRRRSDVVRGTVLEVGNATYARRFGGSSVQEVLVLNPTPGPGTDIAGDLSSPEQLPSEVADCFIMTQTLPFIFDVSSAVEGALKLVKRGGVLLLTVAGITQISRYDMDRWGHYWSFTDLSVRRLLESRAAGARIEIETFGNAKSASAFLYGLACEELSRRDLDWHDRDYQVLIAAEVVKHA
jgi:hypothetical protein